MPGATASWQIVHPMIAIPVIRATTDLSALNLRGSVASCSRSSLVFGLRPSLSGRMGVAKFKDGTQAAAIDFDYAGSPSLT